MTCCGANQVELVQGDTRPTLQLQLYDCLTNEIIDVSPAGTVVYFLLRKVGGNQPVKEALVCQLLPGTTNDDGTINYDPAYSVPGSGGRCEVHWTTTALDTSGSFEGKVEIVWNDGTKQTMPDSIPIQIDPAWQGAP